MIWLILLLLTNVKASLYNVTYTDSSIHVECNRFYEAKTGTCTEAAYSWDGLDDQYPFAGVHRAYNEDGYIGLRRECERACAQGNFCRAYSVSSATSMLQGNIHCNIYDTCAAEVSGNTDLFIRQSPFNCFIKATYAEGVLKNYNDVVNPWSQITRKLDVYVEPFMEVHISVNGVVDENTYAIKPFKEIGEHCDVEDELDCLFLYSGWLGVGLFIGFVALVSGNLILIFTKDGLI